MCDYLRSTLPWTNSRFHFCSLSWLAQCMRIACVDVKFMDDCIFTTDRRGKVRKWRRRHWRQGCTVNVVLFFVEGSCYMPAFCKWRFIFFVSHAWSPIRFSFVHRSFSLLPFPVNQHDSLAPQPSRIQSFFHIDLCCGIALLHRKHSFEGDLIFCLFCLHSPLSSFLSLVPCTTKQQQHHTCCIQVHTHRYLRRKYVSTRYILPIEHNQRTISFTTINYILRQPCKKDQTMW